MANILLIETDCDTDEKTPVIHTLDWTHTNTLCYASNNPEFYPDGDWDKAHECPQDLDSVTCWYCKKQIDYMKKLLNVK